MIFQDHEIFQVSSKLEVDNLPKKHDEKPRALQLITFWAFKK